MDYLYIFGGLIGLFFGGEALVRGSVSIARRMLISPLIIGLTVVGFGTSTPELLVSVQAALRGVPDIALGNIIGSSIANILLIVGLTALVWPIRIAAAAMRRDIIFMIASVLLLVPLFAMGELGRISGLLLVAGLSVYLVLTFLSSREDTTEDENPAAQSSLIVSVSWMTFGFVALLFGAQFLVDGAVSVARGFGVSEAFIGLTIVAIGTSLPELATSLIAAFRHQSDIAIGNVIGSNIFNVLGVLGVTALIAPISVSGRFLSFDLPILIGVSCVLAGVLLTRPQIGRGIGVLMLLGYAAYLYAAR
ncbi:MAG: calcium/sodium antiporter [Cognatishimia sp.]|uniref:calcium/sodium antiporter n=1 Tax=Cognatishimia sp. TaxID=2211648 RepID=UPI00405A3C37